MTRETLNLPAKDINTSAALTAVEGDWKLMSELTEIFLEDLPQQLESLDDALDGGDSSQIFKALHRLKGATGPFFVASVSDLLQEGLSLAESKNLNRLNPKCTEIRKAILSLSDLLPSVSWVEEAGRLRSQTS